MIAGLVIAGLFFLVVLLGWRYDRRHGRRRVGDRTPDMEVQLAEARFESQNPQGRVGNSVL